VEPIAGPPKTVMEPHESLSERQREILTAIIEDFIKNAEPVGSRSLTRRKNIDLSPATVRNAMADLEELGFLSAPHASAGRIPTPRAFRIYVERLAQRGRISGRERELIQAIAGGGGTEQGDITSLLREAGRVLSTVSKHAALVLMPTLEEVRFAHIEFMPIRERSVLTVFVAKSGFIQHRVVETDLNLDRDELTRMSSYLSSLLTGKTLTEVRGEIVRAMADERVQADRMMRQALIIGERMLGTPSTAEKSVVLEGERAFLEHPEFADIEKMRRLLRAFEEKTLLLRLLDLAVHQPIDAQAAASSETAVVRGSESSVKDLKDLAAVTAIYSSEEGPAGRVGVVGPTRMDYARVIPLVELTADALSQSLSPGRPPATSDDDSA
jgi:heat-inducible transcriptional repressor